MSALPESTAPRHPAIELLARYGAIVKAAWAARRELAGPQRLADEAAFLPAALSLQATPPHPAPRRLAITICALFVIALAWSFLGRIDVVAVAPGRIIVSDRSKTLQPLEAGVVKRLFVKDGDRVQAGQVLVELDATNAEADRASLAEQLAAATGDERRAAALLDALRSGRAPAGGHADAAAARLAAEWADIAARLARLDAERSRREAERATVQQLVAKVEAMLPIARQREADYQRLTEQGFVAGHAGQDRTRERIEQERELATQRARLDEAEAALTEAARTRDAYLAETRRALSERRAEAVLRREQLAQESSKAAQRSRLTRLTAPVSGTVQQLAVHTEGGVVTPAQPLMVIVPHEAAVTAEVAIDNKDIGFVRAGQPVTVKLETFPFTRYGTVEATVASVAADAVVDERGGAAFPALLTLGAASLAVEAQAIRLSPGMNLTAEIRLGERSVISYLVGPLKQTLVESLGER